MTERPYTPGQVANKLLDLAERDAVPVTPMKLQKLVYIAFGWGLVLYDIELFDEAIQAWQHGPVIPSLFHEFKVYVDNPIIGRSFHLNADGSMVTKTIPRKDKKARKTVFGTWSAYGHFSASQLRRLTHAPGTPWSQIYDEDDRGKEIPTNVIRQHFLEKRKEILDW